jgi:hypothetical protein
MGGNPIVPGETINVSATSSNLVPTTTSTLPDAIPVPSNPQVSSTPTSTNTNTIRNISQTVQERQIVKLAPDVVCYLDGLPYLINWYIPSASNGNQYTLVNFNDHVTTFNAAYDTDMLIPNATIGLQIPNFMKHFYQMPGGNNLVQPMMEVQVFAKGYFLANNGDTVYRRVFKGMVSHVAYNDNGKTLEISIQCLGTLHFFELMQTAIQISIQTAGALGTSPTFYDSIFPTKNPYEIIAALFTWGLKTPGDQPSGLSSNSSLPFNSGFSQSNLNQPIPGASNDVYTQAVELGYVAKWQAILANISQDVHMYGFNKDNPSKGIAKPSDVRGVQGKNERPASQSNPPTLNETDSAANIYYDKIRQHTPDMVVGDPTLWNNKVVSRMDYLRYCINIINFEGYQDLDGKIIIKPPLYNLDVTNLGPTQQASTPSPQTTQVTSSINGQPVSSTTTTYSGSSSAGQSSNPATNPAIEIQVSTNPFVINLVEILTEQETEDQAAIRKTRMTVRGTPSAGLQLPQYPSDTLNTREYIDLAKLQKFGLREEPIITVPWLQGDSNALFAYAVTETVRQNRGYRTYTFTIPLRPELKLGFPVFIPHKDMYAYIKNISINHQVGGTSTMTVTCDSVRRRVMLPAVQKDSNGNSYTSYTSTPNLIWQWSTTSGTTTGVAGLDASQSPSNNLSYLNNISQGTTTSGSNSSVNPASVVGKPLTLPEPQSLNKIDLLQSALQTERFQRMGTWGCMQPSTPYSHYVVANDTNNVFTNPIPCDQTYLVTLAKGTMPYTDAKGYELVTPFPWGRWENLRTAMIEFTQEGYVVNTGNTDVNGNLTTDPDTAVLQSTQAFIFAGLGTPTATGNASSQLIQALAATQNTADTDSIIILNDNTPASSLLTSPQPSYTNATVQAQLANSQNTATQTIDVLVTGTAAPNRAVQIALAQANTITSNGTTLPSPNNEEDYY